MQNYTLFNKYKAMKNITKNSLLLVVILTLVFSVTSCYKKKDTIAKVTVLDSANSPVGNAEVRLFYGVHADSARIDQTASTDGGGLATFNFNELYKSGQAGFAVLDVYVNGIVSGIIKIEEETTSEETIILP